MTYTISEFGYFEDCGGAIWDEEGNIIEEWDNWFFWLRLPNGLIRAVKKISLK